MKKILLAAILSCSTLFLAQAVEPGAEAPDFTLKDLKGKEVSLAALKGKVVVLEWVNFGCPFVHKHYASGNMAELQKHASQAGAVWISINSSAAGKQGHHPAEQMADIAAKQGSHAAHFVMDSAGTVGRAYGAKVTPHMFIIDAGGKVRYNGAMDSKATTQEADVASAEPWFKDALGAVLAGKPVKHAKNKPYGCGVKYGK